MTNINNSLREEIQEILTECRYEWKKYIVDKNKDQRKDVDVYTDDIISKIEKRIDVLKEKYPEDLYRAYNAALDDLKEEMLK